MALRMKSIGWPYFFKRFGHPLISFPRSINILNIVKYTNHLLIFLFSNVPFSKNKKLKRDEQRGEKKEGSERRGRPKNDDDNQI